MMKNLVEAAQCPICGSKDTYQRIAVTVEEAAAHFVAPEADRSRNRDLAAHLETLWEGQSAALRECNACGFGFSWPFVGGDVRFYELAYSGTSYPTHRWEFDRTIAELEADPKKPNSVLEIGAGNGFFLDQVADKFIARDGIHAMEYYPPSVEVLASKGYTTHHGGDLESLKGHSFDRVFAFQVFEHLDNLSTMMRTLHAVTSDDCKLYIAVPNKRLTQHNEDTGSLLDCPPNHVGRFIPSAFKALAEKSGFRLDQAEVEPFSMLSHVKQDLYYSHLKRSQKTASLAGKVRSIKNRRVRQAAILAEAAICAPLRLPTWVKTWQTYNLGGSLWVALSKA